MDLGVHGFGRLGAEGLIRALGAQGFRGIGWGPGLGVQASECRVQGILGLRREEFGGVWIGA